MAGVSAIVLAGCGARTGLKALEGEARHTDGGAGSDAGEPTSVPCFEKSFQAGKSSVSIHLVVDRSTSMYVFWPDITDALRALVADPRMAGIALALDFFPPRRGAGDECAESTYAVPDIPYGRLLAATGSADPQEMLLLDALAQSAPEGATPLLAAYTGAIGTAREHAIATGDRAVVVLVTDGKPDGCPSNQTAPISNAAAAAAEAIPPVISFAIGLEGADAYLVRSVASEGRGDSFFVGVDAVHDDLAASLEHIRQRLACDYELGGAANVAPRDVHVTLTLTGTASRDLPYDPECTRAGWKLVDSSSPPRISLCPTVCNAVHGDDHAHLAVSARCTQVDPSSSDDAGAGAPDSGSASNPILGAECKSTTDCGSDLTCITAASGAFAGGGPAGGTCTVTCASHADCKAIDADSRCEAAAPGLPRFCVERCTLGPFDSREFVESKCHGRRDFACSPQGESPGVTVCLPRCGADIHCGTGLFCHPRDGLCWPTPAAGLPIGSPCNPAADDCVGSCIRPGEAILENTCTSWCTEGASFQCGWDGRAAGRAPAICTSVVFAVSTRGGPGYGDLDACIALCDSDADCLSSWCEPFGYQPFVDATGRAGACGVSFGPGGPGPT